LPKPSRNSLTSFYDVVRPLSHNNVGRDGLSSKDYFNTLRKGLVFFISIQKTTSLKGAIFIAMALGMKSLPRVNNSQKEKKKINVDRD